MRVSHAASFGVAVSSALGRRRDHELEKLRHQIQDYPRVVKVRSDQAGRSLLEDFQFW
jgi:diphthamide synthase subunit DPH2